MSFTREFEQFTREFEQFTREFEQFTREFRHFTREFALFTREFDRLLLKGSARHRLGLAWIPVEDVWPRFH